MLTVISLFCRCLGWFPVWLLLLSLSFSPAILPVSGLLFGSTLLSAGLHRLLWLRFPHKKKLAFRLGKLVMILFAALCICGCILLGTGPVFSVLLTVPAFLGTHRRLDAEPAQLFTINSYTTFLTAAVIVSVLLAAAYLPSYSSLMIGAVGVISAFFFLLRNQFMLRRFVTRRSNADTAVPAEIRRGNLMLVTGMILLLTLIFVFRTPLIHLLEWLHHCLQQLVYAGIRLFFRVLEQSDSEIPADLEEAAEEAELPPIPGKNNPLWLLLWIPFIAVAYIIWREFLSDWVYDIRLMLQYLAAKLRKADPQNGRIRRTESEDYYDTETTVARERSGRSRQRTWRKALRQWQSMPDSSEKFYAGYRLLLEAPCWTEHPLRQADTVREIRDKWAAYYSPQEALDAVTADFHADRYAEQGLPPEAITDLSAALDCIRHMA